MKGQSGEQTPSDEGPGAPQPATSSITFVTGATVQDTPRPDEPELTLEPGALVGRYVLQRKLGEGGMGVVFVAHDPELQREVALKVMRVGVFGTHATQAQQRMLREAQAMAMVSHPNLVPIYDAGAFGSTIFLAMECVRGQTLEQWLTSGPPLEDIFEVFEQAGAALQAVHEAGLIHRDFKPANVMVTEAGVAKVLDLGIARKLKLSAETDVTLDAALNDPRVSGVDAFSGQLTQRGALVGTPAYMAPEQLGGEAVGPATDQFAFCVALFEALAGCRPLAGKDPLAMLGNLLAGKLRPWPATCEAPEGLRRAIDKGLAIAPGDRFASMRELLDACRAGMGLRGQLRALTRAWVARGRAADSLLMRADQLVQARELLHRPPATFDVTHLEFLRESVRAQQRRHTRRKLVLGGLATATLGLVPTIALLQRRSAQLQVAKRAAIVARIEATRRRVLPLLDSAREQLLMMYAQRLAWWPQLEHILQLSGSATPAERDATLLTSLTRLDHYFRPIVERTRVVSSLHVTSDAGLEFLVFDDPDAHKLLPPYRFYNRLVREDLFGGDAFEVFWPRDPGVLPRTRWLERGAADTRGRIWHGYQPAARKWVATALKRPDGALTWTQPYLFFTTKDPGVTGATVFSHAGHRFVLAVDLMLNDLSRITTEVSGSDYLVCIVTRSQHCVGLPADARFDTAEKVRAFFKGENRANAARMDADAALPTVESLGIPLLSRAMRPFSTEAETYQIELAGEQVLVARAPVGDPELGLTTYVIEKPAP